jgi:serine/threonine protein kinase
MVRIWLEVDIWSVGVMLFQMLCGHFPYHCETNMDTIEAICSEEDLLRTDPNFRDLDCLA